MEAGIVDATGDILIRARTATPSPTTPSRSSTPSAGRRSRCSTGHRYARRPAAWAAGARWRPAARRCRRSTSPAGGGSRSAPGWRTWSGSPCRRQRRQGTGPRRGLAGCGPGLLRLPGHGGVDRRRRGHRPRRAAARRCRRERRARRTRGGRARRPHVRLRRTGLPRSRGVGHGDRRHHRAAGRGGRPGDAPPVRDAGRSGRGVGGQSARPAAGRGGGFGGAGFGDDFFGAAQEEIECRCGLEFARSDPDHPGGASGPTVRWWARQRWRAGRRGGDGRRWTGSGDAPVECRLIAADADPSRPGRSARLAEPRPGAGVLRPDLWWTALGELRRMAPRLWWRSRTPPAVAGPAPVGVPDGHRLRAPRCVPDRADVVSFLEWCRATAAAASPSPGWAQVATGRWTPPVVCSGRHDRRLPAAPTSQDGGRPRSAHRCRRRVGPWS